MCDEPGGSEEVSRKRFGFRNAPHDERSGGEGGGTRFRSEFSREVVSQVADLSFLMTNCYATHEIDTKGVSAISQSPKAFPSLVAVANSENPEIVCKLSHVKFTKSKSWIDLGHEF